MSLFSSPMASRNGSRKSALTRLGGLAFLLFALGLAVFLPPAISPANEPKHSLMSKIGKLKDKLVASLGGQVQHLATPAAPWKSVGEVPTDFHLEWTTSRQWHFPGNDPLLRAKMKESAVLSLYTRCVPQKLAGVIPAVFQAYKPIWSCEASYMMTNPASTAVPTDALTPPQSVFKRIWRRLNNS